MSVSGLSAPFFKAIEIPRPGGLFKRLWLEDIAMDLGTANTLIYIKGKGIVLNEPSVVAVDGQTGKPLAVGVAAKEMYGKTAHAVQCVRPMKDGVIADFDMTTLMIRHMLSQVCSRWSIRKPRLVVGIPSGITQVEKRAVIDAALSCGMREVLLVEEPMAAALGAGLPISKPCGNMIVDIGGGTTEVAILCMNGTAYSSSTRVAGDEMDEAISRHLRRLYGVQVGIFEAERLKLVIGSALAFDQARSTRTFGRDLVSGIPRQIEVTDEIIRQALNEPIESIIAAVITALERTSPEMAQDIINRGIYLAGGGALLKGLPERLQRETGLPFHRAQDPLSCVVRGVGKIVEDLSEMKQLCVA